MTKEQKNLKELESYLLKQKKLLRQLEQIISQLHDVVFHTVLNNDRLFLEIILKRRKR